MSPYLLANSFQVDFYSLYRSVIEQKEKKKKEKELASKLKRLDMMKANFSDKKDIKKLKQEI